MPAGLPGDTLFNNQGNPNAGHFVIMDPLSGPKDSPFDARMNLGFDAQGHPEWENDDSNISTGGLSTGIGFGCNHHIGPTAPQSIKDAGFQDDYIPGVTEPDGGTHADSTLLYIGGGRCDPPSEGPESDGIAAPDPYTAGFAICGAGEGGSRDSGFNTGFSMKMVTAAADIANGAVIETGWVNRSGAELPDTHSAFGSAVTANVVPA